ncbi:hypothetical protein GWI33_018455 [Rhynchophorus ferrugineus]|uniref:Uncharacterized protein n=1 Tax=Rhynchophorus ferrugineus TaxID=354439 RepID=A0A834HTQ9_RHYFE|nr:hypothetical protein GWI33_018455 [Rhynchophorus ferrugineus]
MFISHRRSVETFPEVVCAPPPRLLHPLPATPTADPRVPVPGMAAFAYARSKNSRNSPGIMLIKGCFLVRDGEWKRLLLFQW